MRRSTSGAAGSGLGTTIKYLRSAAGIGLGTTIKLLQRTTGVTTRSFLHFPSSAPFLSRVLPTSKLLFCASSSISSPA
jgi:hypothetical protein